MDTTGRLLTEAHAIYSRASNETSHPADNKDKRPPVYKGIGIALAIASGVFIGTSFVLKKTGLLRANVKYNEEAGEGYGYLKNTFWWTGMTLMIIGEICNFVAYGFVDAILVTPLGALSVVLTTILSAIFLKERLSFVGKVGCFMCIIGSVVIVLNAPEQSAAGTIQEMKKFVLAPGFLSYAGVVIVACTFIALWVGPRYGKKSMLVYLSICSLIGGLSVVATQGLGAAVLSQARGISQFKEWFLYVLFVFVVATLITEIIFLNVSPPTKVSASLVNYIVQKALNLFNAALVTPTYYVFFTSSTIVTSAILFQGFKGSVKSIITVVLGFFQICAGVVLLQLSKSAKDVPDTAVFKGDLDQVRTVAEQEEPESEPKADAIRGAAAIIRRISVSRQKAEAMEAHRIQEEKLRDQMEPIGENEHVEWDGLRRRRTVLTNSTHSLRAERSMHPPLGMSHFPDSYEETRHHNASDPLQGNTGSFNGSFLSSVRRRAQSALVNNQHRDLGAGSPEMQSPIHPVALTEISIPEHKGQTPTPKTVHFPGREPYEEHQFGLPHELHRPQTDGARDTHTSESLHPSSAQSGRPLAWAEDPRHNPRSPGSNSDVGPTPPPHSAKRQFSFQNVFGRNRRDSRPETSSDFARPTSATGARRSIGSRSGSRGAGLPGILKNATEEERLGLVKGDSSTSVLPGYTSDDEEKTKFLDDDKAPPRINEEKEMEDYEAQRQRWLAGKGGIGIYDNSSNGSRDGSRSDSEKRRDWSQGPGNGPGGGAFI